MEQPDGKCDIVVIGASAGGIGVLKELVAGLPADFGAAVFVVVHTAPEGGGYLAPILDRYGPLPADFPEDGETIRTGRIYAAPPDRHLVLGGDHVHLTRAPRENWSRPAINTLFRSAAAAYGSRVVAVLLTGMLDNGTAGLLAVEAAGGVTVVQDPDDAPFPEMPRTALEYLDPDHVVAVADMAALLVALAGTAPAEPVTVPSTDRSPPLSEAIEAGFAPAGGDSGLDRSENTASGFTCPECTGPLWEVDEHGFTEYVCRTGHVYGAATLLERQAERRDQQLEVVLQSTREQAEFVRRMLRRGRERQVDSKGLERYERRLVALEKEAAQIERFARLGPAVSGG